MDLSFDEALLEHRYFTSSDLLKDSSYTQYFKIHQNRYQPQKENGPSTINSDDEYAGISDRKYGYCWGYSTLVRYFSVLAFFDPTLPRRSDIGFYKDKIDLILSGHATLIPGYANLRELSLNPEIEFYLKLNAMELWRSRALRASSLGIFRRATDLMSATDVERLLSDLERKIEFGQFPKLIFSSLIPSEKVLGMNTDIHVVLAYKVVRLPRKRARIYLWDINFYSETLKKEPKYLEINENSGIRYQPWYEPKQPYAEGSALISRVITAPEDDAENVQMLKSLKAFCENRTTMHYCTAGTLNSIQSI